MGWIGPFLFGNEDAILVDEIAKLHKVDREIVEKCYREMLTELKNIKEGE